MPLPVSLDLQLVRGASFFGCVTVSAQTGAQIGLLNATAELRIGITPQDPTPIIDVTTTSGAQGGLVLGVTFPSPGGLAVSNAAGLAQIVTPPNATLDLPSVSLAVASVTALEAAPTTLYALGSLAFVSTGAGAYYAWSPLDPSTPNGTTIVAGAGGTGNWLLAGTATVSLTPAATATLAGYDTARWAMIVTFADGDEVELVAGRVYVLPELPAEP